MSKELVRNLIDFPLVLKGFVKLSIDFRRVWYGSDWFLKDLAKNLIDTQKVFEGFAKELD